MAGPASMSHLASSVKMAVPGGCATDIGPAGHMASLHMSAMDNLAVLSTRDDVAGSLASMILTVADSGDS
jgi:hypothetical protein